jgi:hypothetical protein
MKIAADKIFQTLVPTCPHFMAVVLDVRDCEGADYGRATIPFAFIRSKQIDPTRRSTYVGSSVKVAMVKHYAPCFDMLDPEAYI